MKELEAKGFNFVGPKEYHEKRVTLFFIQLEQLYKLKVNIYNKVVVYAQRTMLVLSAGRMAGMERNN